MTDIPSREPQPVEVPVDGALSGFLLLPQRATGLVVFAHGRRSNMTPTLLIVAGLDPQAVDINRQAIGAIPGESRLEIVPGATRLFEEAGRLDNVGLLARDWFLSHFVGTDESGEQAR